jgi:hypothetical protein
MSIRAILIEGPFTDREIEEILATLRRIEQRDPGFRSDDGDAESFSEG